MRSPTLRAALALILLSAWMALLFAGVAGGGAIHLLLVGAGAMFPWRTLWNERPRPATRIEPAIKNEPP